MSGGRAALLATIDQWLAVNDVQKMNHMVGFINPHVYNIACVHQAVQTFLGRADMLSVDGVGVKLVLLLREGRWVARVVAEHLFNAFLSTTRPETSAVLIGAEPGEVETAAEAMNNSSGGLHIISCVDGYRHSDDYRQFLSRHADIDVVLIGAGSPRSEGIALIADSVCESAVIFHIGGGTLKTWAGTKKRGPAVVSLLGMEWFHRIVFEPHTRQRYTRGFWLYVKNLLSKRSSAVSESEGDAP